ncbi:nucleoside triphosphate pyrophosphohydrolase family protein [Philodulcilactobacillus myokoensis]|nr:nucleoside triphosphate pyrophosphohydrolase family protein [Philodulcilactobacillus myokoensis]
MNLNEYQKKANSTLKGQEQILTNCALGLSSKSGQVANLIKQYTFDGQNLDRAELIRKMGDVLWYLSQIAQWENIPFEDVGENNINRLSHKYHH